MKTAVSIPDELFQAADRAAKRLGISRSELFARAVRDFLGAQRDAAVTQSYDRAFGDDEGDHESFRREASRLALLDVEWKDE